MIVKRKKESLLTKVIVNEKPVDTTTDDHNMDRSFLGMQIFVEWLRDHLAWDYAASGVRYGIWI